MVRLGAAIIIAGVLVPATDAVALWDDKLELFASQTLTRDDNVFRISSLVPAAVLGSSSKGDTYYTTSLGFNLDVPVSRQRFQGGVTWSKTRFDRFTILNWDGYQGQGTWLWQLGNDISGQLGYTDTFVLASLANIQSGVQSSTPNFLTRRRAFFNAAYMLTPRWRLRGEAGRFTQSNELPARRLNDTGIDSVDLTVSYVTPASNQIGFGVRAEDARLPNREFVAGDFFDNSYRQQNVAAVADWILGGSSRVNARVGSIRRSYAQLPQRDFEGATFHAGYDWSPTGKLILSASAQKDISSTEEILIGFVLVKGVALQPTLRLTDKLNIAALLDYSDREYRSDPALVLAAVPNRTDHVRSAAVTISYRPIRTVALQMSLLHQTRSSMVAFGDYAANVVSMSARIGF